MNLAKEIWDAIPLKAISEFISKNSTMMSVLGWSFVIAIIWFCHSSMIKYLIEKSGVIWSKPCKMISEYKLAKARINKQKERIYLKRKDKFDALISCFSDDLGQFVLNMGKPTQDKTTRSTLIKTYLEEIIPEFFHYCDAADSHSARIQEFFDGVFSQFFSKSIPEIITVFNMEPLLSATHSQPVCHYEESFAAARGFVYRNTWPLSCRRRKLLKSIKKCYE